MTIRVTDIVMMGLSYGEGCLARIPPIPLFVYLLRSSYGMPASYTPTQRASSSVFSFPLYTFAAGAFWKVAPCIYESADWSKEGKPPG